ncbi:uncharacterized protein [Ptychodera flava]|uniref:uncharacterized protein n=1 Tax=Ptychodera flava TaxID=63121 RepID=UPI00396AAE3C
MQKRSDTHETTLSDITSQDMDTSQSSIESDYDDVEDLSFNPDSVEDSLTDTEGDEPCDIAKSLAEDRKFIVFEQQLDILLNCLTCPQCNSSTSPDDTKKKTTDGTLLSVTTFCFNGHRILQWDSQPCFGKMPAGNLLVSAAILISGLSYQRISHFAMLLNLEFIGKSTYFLNQKNYVSPSINAAWEEEQRTIIQDNSRTTVNICGDGRCDSPGYSAKYCTYTVIDEESSKILNFSLVQSSEVGSSSRMEKEGCKRVVDYLTSANININILATDRHVQIRSMLLKEYPGIKHQFDVWHFSNSIKKRLTQAAKKKGCEDLNPWIKSICNHLWWCAAQCEGDEQLLVEMWSSIGYHVANKHKFPRRFSKVKACVHGPISREAERKKKWMKMGSAPHKALMSIVTDKRILKDIKHLSEFCHTGSLEVYHSMMTKYVPKRQEFDYEQMLARTQLAALDHNANVGRAHRRNKNGDLQWRPVCPKATNTWIVKKVYEEKSYEWAKQLIVSTLLQKIGHDKSVPVASTRTHHVNSLPKNIAPVPAPPKEDLLQRYQSRFQR